MLVALLAFLTILMIFAVRMTRRAARGAAA
jgi:hypothetical protein